MNCNKKDLHFLSYVGLIASLVAFAPIDACAMVYRVGPDEELKTPSQAARLVHSGDTVQIEPLPGGYYDCAIWGADDLTIEGIGNDVRLTDTTCQGKAIFITTGKRITIRNLVFARARVPDRNGAGIRAEGEDLHVENSRFINNESGILAATSPNSKITILNSQFTANGKCAFGHCTAAIAVDQTARLTVINSEISGLNGGNAIRSLAAHTRLVGNKIEDGAGGMAAFLVDLPAGGSLEMQDNILVLGRELHGPNVAVRVMEGPGAGAVKTLVFSGNTLRSDTHDPLILLLNWTASPARMENNHLPRDATPVSSSGYLWFFTKASIHRALEAAKASARSIRHGL